MFQVSNQSMVFLVTGPILKGDLPRVTLLEQRCSKTIAAQENSKGLRSYMPGARDKDQEPSKDPMTTCYRNHHHIPSGKLPHMGPGLRDSQGSESSPISAAFWLLLISLSQCNCDLDWFPGLYKNGEI